MAGNAGGFEDDPMAPGCYSQLLFGDDLSGLDTDGCNYGFAPPFSPDDDNNNNNNNNNNTPKMLCFGDYAKPCSEKVTVENAKKTGREPGPACKDTSLLISNKKRKGSGTQDPGSQCGAPTVSPRNNKKPKSDNSTVSGHAKVAKKEKLGDRVAALQQLVSPFGKTDTASVLHEALGYIRFLHDQVQVLCSPYLQSCHPDDGDSKESKRSKNDLRSQGLCLVPVELTLHVADSNGADLWSPAAMVDTVPTS